jgi:hypothetical protein
VIYPVRRADGTTVDIAAIPFMTDADKLKLIGDVLANAEAEDADKYEADKYMIIEKIETILTIPRSGA